METKTEVRIVRTYPVAPEKVWRAWTDPKAMSQWFGPGPTPTHAKADIDLSVGGQYRIAFSSPDGESHGVSGVYQEVEPNRRLVFSWAFQSTPERVSRITIELKPVAEGTELTFVHDRFFNQQARDNHARGWPEFFVNLENFVQE